ncbi:MAG TPA: hypothetical protein VGQ81_11220 [Acidobacteriota bacterium]|jgi:hypothetical protein|nr:hypothetical protein [Acidobacteriota bacterium]
MKEKLLNLVRELKKDGPGLTGEEAEFLLRSLTKTRGERSFTELEARTVIQWAHTTKVGYDFLKAILEGKMQIDVADGEIVFLAPETVQ